MRGALTRTPFARERRPLGGWPRAGPALRPRTTDRKRVARRGTTRPARRAGRQPDNERNGSATRASISPARPIELPVAALAARMVPHPAAHQAGELLFRGHADELTARPAPAHLTATVLTPRRLCVDGIPAVRARPGRLTHAREYPRMIKASPDDETPDSRGTGRPLDAGPGRVIALS